MPERSRLAAVGWALGAALLLLASQPARAFSRLAAWRIDTDGVLELRTSPNINLDAFYLQGDERRGDRVWIDFPGSPQRPRKIRGRGAVREVRVGMPERGVTRLVIEFQPGAQLDPGELRLVGVAWDRWRLLAALYRPFRWRVWQRYASTRCYRRISAAASAIAPRARPEALAHGRARH